MRALSVALALLFAAGMAGADEVSGAREALNAFRAQADLAPLEHSARLQQAAERHARDLSRGTGLSHRGTDGSTVGARVERTGYRYCTVAENLGRGQRSLEQIMQGWAASPGHRDNMLLPGLRDFGLARQAGDIWVLVLAAPGC